MQKNYTEEVVVVNSRCVGDCLQGFLRKDAYMCCQLLEVWGMGRGDVRACLPSGSITEKTMIPSPPTTRCVFQS